jgi:Trk K+ transport system NAD-binding subunit
LGSLGQYCVAKLKEFGVAVSAIDVAAPTVWEVPEAQAMLEDLVFGDCRQPEVLEQAKIQQYRAVLLVTSDERINIDAAFAVRVLNPEVRLIVRSAKENLNELLDQQLGHFSAFAASQLTAPAFAIAALGSEVQGLINLDGSWLQVRLRTLDDRHPWCNRRYVHELNGRTCRILNHTSGGDELPTSLYQWEPEAKVQPGDRIAYVELAEELSGFNQPFTINSANSAQVKRVKQKQSLKQRWQGIQTQFSVASLRQRVVELWRSTAHQQAKRVVILVGTAELTLIVMGIVVLKSAHPDESWLKALYVTGVMLLGSYDTVFGALSATDSTPLWMRFMNLTYMLAGTAAIAVLYALLTEALLAAKFQLQNRRPPVPLQDHIVLVGLDTVGRHVATQLQNLKQPIVGVSPTDLDPSVLPQMPLVVGDLTTALTEINLATAKSVVVATDNEIVNLELGLMANAVNPNSDLVIRTFDPRFSNNLARILPRAEILCVYALAAEAFTAAVFGEHILGLFRLNEETILVADYTIHPEDPFNGLLLAEVTHGYGMVPLLYQAIARSSAKLMPSEDIQLDPGDRLVVLTTTDSLQQLERGEILPRCWQVQVDRAVIHSANFEGIRLIVRVTGCSINTATDLMEQLPGILPMPLYKHQAQRLVRELGKLQIIAQLIPLF